MRHTASKPQTTATGRKSVVSASQGARFVITIPHASGALPPWQAGERTWDPAGDRVFETHHALDRGVKELGQQVHDRVQAEVVEALFSRLFLDMNRSLEDPAIITRSVNGVVLPFNEALCPDELAARRSAYRRFHASVQEALGRDSSIPPFLVDLHSFDRFGTGAVPRTVDIGVCAPDDGAFAGAVLWGLQSRTEDRAATDWADPVGRRINVRFDEPYPGSHAGAYVVRQHGHAAAGAVAIEVCDDLLRCRTSITAVAELLAASLIEAATTCTPTICMSDGGSS